MEEDEDKELYAECYPQLIRDRVIWSRIKTPPEYITLTFKLKKEHSTLMETE